MKAPHRLITAVCLAFAAFGASAQQDLEPAVQTSPATAAPGKPGTTNTNGGGSPAKPAQAPPAKSAASGPRAPTPASTSAAPGAPAGAAGTAGAAPKAGKSSDRIELDTTQISGNRELPKVMYVVPWRRADPGEFTGRPLNSLLDEALTPVDRDVFRRQNRYYAELSGGAASDRSQPGAAGDGAAAPTPKDEK
jgi:hypothetical protein